MIYPFRTTSNPEISQDFRVRLQKGTEDIESKKVIQYSLRFIWRFRMTLCSADPPRWL